MAFDAGAFLAAKLETRTEDVRVPELAAWFGEGEEPIWRVRGLVANELVKSESAKQRLSRETALLDALASGKYSSIVEGFRSLVGRNDEEVDPEVARRLELLCFGSVQPECSMELSVRMGEHFPVSFLLLTNTILKLTGQGSDAPKKRKSSGDDQTSEPAAQ